MAAWEPGREVDVPTTMCEGIEFRSRTEAAWYLVLKDYGLKPVYEPETFEIATTWDKDDPSRRSCWYMPDFAITIDGYWCPGCCRLAPYTSLQVMVEIKSGISGEMEDIAKACVLGYQVPTLIIVGWPIGYSAIVFHERHKGRPLGYRVAFGIDVRDDMSEKWANENPSVFWQDEVLLEDSNPDEDWLKISDRDIEHFIPQTEPSLDSRAYQIARNSWNRTKWNPFPKS